MSIDYSPSYEKSVFDKISDALAPAYRTVGDFYTTTFGTLTQLLRITSKVRTRKINDLQQMSVLGHYDSEFEDSVINNCYIEYPFDNIEIFLNKELDSLGGDVNISGIDVTEILPIVVTLIYKGKYKKDPIALTERDLLVDVFWDANDNPIPIILEAGKQRGTFFGKNEISKKIEMRVMRGTLDAELTKYIKDYLEFVRMKRAEKC